MDNSPKMSTLSYGARPVTMRLDLEDQAIWKQGHPGGCLLALIGCPVDKTSILAVPGLSETAGKARSLKNIKIWQLL